MQLVASIIERNIFMESNNDKSKISLNRKMRLWNRYRNYVIGLAVIVVLVVIKSYIMSTSFLLCG